MSDLNDEINLKMQEARIKLDQAMVRMQRDELLVEIGEKLFGSNYIACKFPDLFSYVHDLPKCVGPKSKHNQ